MNNSSSENSTAADAQPENQEALIRKKMAVGLSREQAIASIKNQAAFSKVMPARATAQVRNSQIK